MSGNQEFSLYIHTPFCTKKCPYCHFYVLKDDEQKKDRLLEALQSDWIQWAEKLSQNRLVSIYLGGGTPTLFGAQRIQSLLYLIAQSHALDTIEISIEANPETLTRSLLVDLQNIGINRLSIGIQSFNDHLLKSLGRTHTAQNAHQAVIEAADAGFQNITIDLMYDLPSQNLNQWQQSLDKAISLPITHLSLYNLTIEPKTPFYRKKNALEKTVPTQEISKNMYCAAVETLQKAGLEHYEISAFAKPGFTSLHNTGYWSHRPYIGLGPSAHSFFQGKRFRSVPNFEKYCHAIENRLSPIDEEELLTEEELAREKLTLKLRMFEGALLKDEKFHPKKTIEKFINQGLLEKKESLLRLTPKGALFYDYIAVELI